MAKRILITGASGFIGRALSRHLKIAGNEIFTLSRKASADPSTVVWDPLNGVLDLRQLESFDAVIHLAGENIGSGYWTAAKRRRIWDSRVNATRLLAQHLLEVRRPPAKFLCASAVGFYGPTGEDWVTEASPPGEGFLASVCQAWEKSAGILSDRGWALGFLRFGVVLGRGGGMLAQILPLFKLGMGGRLGSGRQHLSWVALPDLVRAVEFLLAADICGPVNITAPAPVTNGEFTSLLGKTLRRPVFCRVPAWILRLVAGRQADELLLAGVRARPERLVQAGFQFNYPRLEDALRGILA